MVFNEDFFEAKFPFIADNLFLVAWVGKKSGKQRLKIQNINPISGKIEFEDTLNCIHTAITTISYETFLEAHEDEVSAENFAKDMINARTTETLQTVNLSPEEHFFSFKSWTQGIAEAGLDALNLQTNIEATAQFQYPIVDFLLKSLVKNNFDYVGLFLENIKKKCKYEGIYHKPSLRANLDILLEIIASYLDDESKKDAILDILLDIAEIDSEFLFRDSNFYIRRFIVSNEQFSKYEEYKQLIPNEIATSAIEEAKNPDAPNFEEYKTLFEDNDWRVRQAVAANPNAPRFEEYKKLFSENKENIDDTDYYWDDWGIRPAIAANLNATKFLEYKTLFEDDDWRVRQAVATNPNATKFEEYKSLFEDNNWRVRQAVAANPNATKFEDYVKLYNDKNKEVQKAILKNLNALKKRKDI